MSRRGRIALAAAALGAGVVLLVLLLRGGDEERPRNNAAPNPHEADATAPIALVRDSPLRRAPAATPLADAAAAAPRAAAGCFEGRVLSARDETGVAGAELTFLFGVGAVSARTGEDGAFRFEAPWDGLYRLARVQAEGFVPHAPTPRLQQELVPQPGACVGGITVRMRPLTQYEGIVVDPFGTPLAGAEVRNLGLGGFAGTEQLLEQERLLTDAKGAFRLASVSSAILEARHEAFNPGRVRLPYLHEPGLQIVIRLRVKGEGTGPGAPISGRVLGASREPIEGATVIAYFHWKSGHWREAQVVPGRQATSDEAGRFVLDGLDDVHYDVTATMPGFAAEKASDVAPGARDLVLRLERGAVVEGTVRDGSRNPVTSFDIRARRYQAGKWLHADQRTVHHREGRFKLTDLAPGSYRFQVSRPGGGGSAEIEAEVRESGSRRLEFVLEGAVLRGRVVEKGSEVPVPGAWVAAISRGTFGGSTRTDRSGEFVLSDLKPDPVRLSVYVEGFEPGRMSLPSLEEEAKPVVIQIVRKAARREDVADVGVSTRFESQALQIIDVLPGSPAAEAGLVPGDAILRVGDQQVHWVMEPRDLLRGLEGSEANLVVRKGDGRTVNVAVRRRLLAP